jgi:hypothetical protein
MKPYFQKAKGLPTHSRGIQQKTIVKLTEGTKLPVTSQQMLQSIIFKREES